MNQEKWEKYQEKRKAIYKDIKKQKAVTLLITFGVMLAIGVITYLFHNLNYWAIGGLIMLFVMGFGLNHVKDLNKLRIQQLDLLEQDEPFERFQTR